MPNILYKAIIISFVTCANQPFCAKINHFLYLQSILLCTFPLVVSNPWEFPDPQIPALKYGLIAAQKIAIFMDTMTI